MEKSIDKLIAQTDLLIEGYVKKYIHSHLQKNYSLLLSDIDKKINAIVRDIFEKCRKAANKYPELSLNLEEPIYVDPEGLEILEVLLMKNFSICMSSEQRKGRGIHIFEKIFPMQGVPFPPNTYLCSCWWSSDNPYIYRF